MGKDEFEKGIVIEPDPFQDELPDSVELFHLDGTADNAH